METWKKHLVDAVEDAQHFLESKEIHSFEAVKEYFKNVFYQFINEVDESQASLVEKRHEIYFYLGESSMSIIDMGEQMTVWKSTSVKSNLVATLFFNEEHCFVRYNNQPKIHYLSEDEIEDLFNEVFLQETTIH